MRSTIWEAVFQAVSLASAGLRLEPERKNRRVKEMKMNVMSTDQAVDSRRLTEDIFLIRLRRKRMR